MLKAICSAHQSDRGDVEQNVQLTFPILFERADHGDDRAIASAVLPCADDRPAAPLSDAMREMIAWSPWTASAPARDEPHAPSGWLRQPQRDEQWQVRVEMTLDDAEALVEGLCSLIALAKENAVVHSNASPPALAFAGTKIGADYRAAPPRFSSAQLESISRDPASRRLAGEQNGRLVHRLFASARIEKLFPS